MSCWASSVQHCGPGRCRACRARGGILARREDETRHEQLGEAQPRAVGAGEACSVLALRPSCTAHGRSALYGLWAVASRGRVGQRPGELGRACSSRRRRRVRCAARSGIAATWFALAPACAFLPPLSAFSGSRRLAQHLAFRILILSARTQDLPGSPCPEATAGLPLPARRDALASSQAHNTGMAWPRGERAVRVRVCSLPAAVSWSLLALQFSSRWVAERGCGSRSRAIESRVLAQRRSVARVSDERRATSTSTTSPGGTGMHAMLYTCCNVGRWQRT